MQPTPMDRVAPSERSPVGLVGITDGQRALGAIIVWPGVLFLQSIGDLEVCARCSTDLYLIVADEYIILLITQVFDGAPSPPITCMLVRLSSSHDNGRESKDGHATRRHNVTECWGGG